MKALCIIAWGEDMVHVNRGNPRAFGRDDAWNRGIIGLMDAIGATPKRNNLGHDDVGLRQTRENVAEKR